MNQIEFRMETGSGAITPPALKFNYEELKAFLSTNLEQYKTVVIAEDDIGAAKADRAKLNKLTDSINSYRISVKKQLMEQYDTDFKPKCDELTVLCKEAVDNLDLQIKAFEQRTREKKLHRLKEHYNADSRDEAKEYLTWDKLCNPRWGNKTYMEDDAKAEITAALSKTVEELAAIRAISPDDSPYLLDFYRTSLDFGATVRKAEEIAKRREIEMHRRAERERMEAEERARIAAMPGKPTENPAQAVTPQTSQPVERPTVRTDAQAAEERLYALDFRVWVTRKSAEALKIFLKSSGIKYGPVPQPGST